MSKYQGAPGGPHVRGLDGLYEFEEHDLPPQYKGYPLNNTEGVESPNTWSYAAKQDMQFRQQFPEMFEERDHVEIQGHELTEDRGKIQVAGAGYYFPNFY